MDPIQPTLPEEETTNFHDYFNVVLRRWKTVFLVFLLVFLGSVYHTYRQKPIYEAFATLQVEKGQEGFAKAFGMPSDDSMAKEIQLIHSRSLAEKVAENLRLDWRIVPLESSEKSRTLLDLIRQETLDVAARLLSPMNGSVKTSATVKDFSSPEKYPSFRIEILGPGTYRIQEPGGTAMGIAAVGETFKNDRLTLCLGELKGKVGDRFSLSKIPLYQIASQVQAGIQAVEVSAGTRMIRLAYKDTDPQRAQQVVNALADVYREQSIERKTQESKKTVEFIGGQVEKLWDTLEASQKNLKQYRIESGLKILGPDSNLLVEKLVELDKKLTGLEMEKKRLEFAQKAIAESMKTGKTYVPMDLEGRSSLADQAIRLTDLALQKRILLSKFTESHPAVRELQEQIDNLERKISATFESATRDLEWEKGQIVRIIKDHEQKLVDLSPAELELARMSRISDVNVGIYTFLLQKQEEASIARAAAISDIHIVDSAITPTTPIKPDKKKNLKMGALFGLFLGIALAFFLEYIDDTVKDSEKAKILLGVPMLGSIPYISSNGKRAKDSKDCALLTRMEPKSAVAEAFRGLRTGLHYSAINTKKKVHLVTSSVPGEGKTTICVNLAMVMAQAGSRVALIGCDLRRPSLDRIFTSHNGKGLTEVLIGDVSIETTICSTELENLHFIPAGTPPPNPAELLGSAKMREVLEDLRGKYDQILLDAPPLMAVTDAALLAEFSDMVLVVLESGRIPKKVLTRLKETLHTIKAPVAGFIMNDKTSKAARYYGYYGKSRYYGSKYGYGYGYGYGYYSDDGKKKRGWFGKKR